MIPGVSKHARQRMVEHHGRDLTKAEWHQVVLDVIDGRSVVVRRAGEHSGEIHDVVVAGMTFRVAWEPMRGHIVTVLRDTRTTCRISARYRGGRGRASIKIGRGFYDREGNRI